MLEDEPVEDVLGDLPVGGVELPDGLELIPELLVRPAILDVEEQTI